MKVLFLLHQGNMYAGGQGVYTFHVTRELLRLGHEVQLVVGPPWPTMDPRVRVHRVPSYSMHPLVQQRRECFRRRGAALQAFAPINFYEIGSSLARQFSVMHAFSWRAYARWRELQRRHCFDIVHDVQVLGYGSLMIHASGMPMVANVHHPLSIDRAHQLQEARTLRRLIAAAWTHPFVMQEVVARRMDRIITGSGETRSRVRESFGVQAGSLEMIYDGVDTDVFRPLELARRSDGLLFVGNSDDSNKGARYLIEAAAILRDRGNGFHLTIVDRPDARTARSMVRDLRLDGDVTFTGRLATDELVRAYNECQLAISPSLYEGFGLPAAEAMACGTPVVATTAGAFPEVIDDGETGVLVRPANAGALADAIERLLADPARCRAMGAAGARRVASRFTWTQCAARTAAVYERVLSERRKEGGRR